jgi:hypothetical protein
MTDVLFAAASVLVFDLPINEKRHFPRIEGFQSFSGKLTVLSLGY